MRVEKHSVGTHVACESFGFTSGGLQPDRHRQRKSRGCTPFAFRHFGSRRLRLLWGGRNLLSPGSWGQLCGFCATLAIVTPTLRASPPSYRCPEAQNLRTAFSISSRGSTFHSIF